MNTVYIHIGLQKTGTTSFQRFCKDNIQFLESQGVKYYASKFWQSQGNANEIAVLILREGVWNGYANNISEIKGSEQQREENFQFTIQEHVNNFLRASENYDVLVSGENMSLMRTLEEARRCKEIFTQAGHLPHVILVLRDLEDWWNSYCNQMLKKERTCSKYYNSMAYIEDPCWLKNIDLLKECISSEFDNVTVIDYSDDIISKLLATVGVKIPDAVTQYKLNKRVSKAYILFLPLRKKLAKFYRKHVSETALGRIKRKIIRKSLS